jgi:MFS family permease
MDSRSAVSLPRQTFLYIQRIVLTFWIGGIWATGYLVVPVIFKSLENKSVAGQVAGNIFTVMSWAGLASALVLVLCYWFVDRSRWRYAVLLLMFFLVLVNLFVLTPQIDAIRESVGTALQSGSEIYRRFAMLHGIASGLFLVVSLLGLLLVIRQPA